MMTAAVIAGLTGGMAMANEVAKPTDEQRKRGEEAVRIVERAWGTAGQEAANFLWNEWPRNHLKMLLGEVECPSESAMQWSEDVVRDLAATAGKGPEWPKPPHITIPKASAAPPMDGNLAGKAWKNARTMTNLYLFGEATASGPATTMKMMWDKDYLYFAFDCETDTIYTVGEKRDDDVYGADCVEMFICTEQRTKTYWELVINPDGVIFDALHTKKLNGWGPISRPGEDIAGLKTFTKRTAKGYVVEVAVPWNQLPEYSMAKPAKGQTFSFMLARLDKVVDAEGKEKLNCYAFCPLLSWGHNVWNHATAELE